MSTSQFRWTPSSLPRRATSRWRGQPLTLRATKGRDNGAAQAVLLPVKMAPAAVAADRASASVSAPAGVIEIDIGGVRVRLRGAVDEANLRCVLHTLKASA
ncbi:MAG: hypothetical protein U1E89_14910 [Burkholderiaceae bacterium]